MTRKPLKPTSLFVVLMVALTYIALSAAWLFFAAPSLISSASTIEVMAGFFGTAAWLIVSTCLYFAINRNPGR